MARTVRLAEERDRWALFFSGIEVCDDVPRGGRKMIALGLDVWADEKRKKEHDGNRVEADKALALTARARR